MKHPLYNIWNGIRHRCGNPKNSSYRRYGGRGVRMSPEWSEFREFVRYVESQIGERPTNKHSLDRIDVNKGYEPGNIRWATQQEQEANKRPHSRGGVSWKYRPGHGVDILEDL